MKFEKTKNPKVALVATKFATNANLLVNVNTATKPSTKANPEYVVPKRDTRNISGKKAYSKDVFTHLLTLLNTVKLNGNQFYREESTQMTDVTNAVIAAAKVDPFLTAQCVRWSRTNGDGYRSVSHLASAVLAKYISGLDFAKHFFGKYNKKTNVGGVINRLDDAIQICNVYFALNPSAHSLSNALRKGLRSALENADVYELAKYKNGLVDVINLTHANPQNSKAMVEVESATLVKVLNNRIKTTKSKTLLATYKEMLDGIDKQTTSKVSALFAICVGLPLTANTHEARNSEVGQVVAAAKKSGKITEAQAIEILAEGKNQNFKELLKTNKLGMLALVRNLRNFVQNNVDVETKTLAIAQLTNVEAIRKSSIHPMELMIAYEVLASETNGGLSREFQTALETAIELAIPNLNIQGDVLVIVDGSGSMDAKITKNGDRQNGAYSKSALDAACLLGSVICKATNADVLAFGSSIKEVDYNPNQGVFALAKELRKKCENMGGTNIALPFQTITRKKKSYDFIFLLSDNEANAGGSTAKACGDYVKTVSNAMIYSWDLAGYGTTQLKGENVYECFGYGFAAFEDIAKRQFNPEAFLDEVKKVRFV